MSVPCEKCVKKFERAVGEYEERKESAERIRKDGRFLAAVPTPPPDLGFLKECPYQMEHCPLKGGGGNE